MFGRLHAFWQAMTSWLSDEECLENLLNLLTYLEPPDPLQ